MVNRKSTPSDNSIDPQMRDKLLSDDSRTLPESTNVYLYGAGGHANVVKDVLRGFKVNVIATFDDNLSHVHPRHINTRPGIRTVGRDSFLELGHPMVIGIGDNHQRKMIADQLPGPFIKLIHDSVLLAPQVTIGLGTVVLHGSIIQTDAKIGRHVLINTGAQIDHDNVIGDFVHISPNATLCGHVEIGEGTQIGAGATVIPSVRIGRWCVIGAGAVVINDIPDYSTAVGNPARIIKRRNLYFHGQDDTRAMVANDRSGTASRQYDLTFVGGGISSTFTLLHLIERLREQPPTSPVQILFVDQAGDVFSGLPYGSRAGRSSLLITNLVDFLPDPERMKFKAWIKSEAETLLAEIRQIGGPSTEDWYEKYESQVRLGDVDEVYLPRQWFGKFLRHRTQAAIAAATREKLVDVVTRTVTVKSITNDGVSQANPGYRLELSDSHDDSNAEQEFVNSKRVVFAIGAPPVASQLEEIRSKTSVLVVDNLYEPGFQQNLRELQEYIELRSSEIQEEDADGTKLNIAVVGSNASAMEFIYHLNDIDVSKKTRVFMISPSGEVPRRNDSLKVRSEFETTNVDLLHRESVIVADDILGAVELDHQRAIAENVAFSTSYSMTWKAVVKLLPKLSRSEKLRFANYHGFMIGRLQRRVGNDHANILDAMKKDKRLVMCKGGFAGLSPETDRRNDDADAAEAQKYRARLDIVGPDGAKVRSKFLADIIINCGPVESVGCHSSSALLNQVLETGLMTPNKSARGVQVNDTFESSPNLYLMGPMLAGNVINESSIWHTEHCGRLYYLSGKLGTQLAGSLKVDTPSDMDISLIKTDAV